MRLFPSSPRRPLVLLLLGAALVWALWPRHRMLDEAGVISAQSRARFDRFLAQIHDESGVDVRILIVPDVPGGNIERFALERARLLGVGRDVDRRGALIVYDMGGQRMRIEVGPRLEEFFPDGFVGYLMREHARSFFAARQPVLGLRTTLFIVQHRLREAALGRRYDPGAVVVIRDSTRLAMGGGATAAIRLGDTTTFLGGASTDAERDRFAPQPSVAEAYARYLEWVRDGGYRTDVPLFTPATRGYLRSLPMTRAYNEYILFAEHGQRFEVVARDDLALLYFTETPILSPHFFRRTPEGWQMDISSEVANTRNYAGARYAWGLVSDGDFARAFRDRYAYVGGAIRLTDGDNRALPVLRDWFSAGAGPPIPIDAPLPRPLRLAVTLLAWAAVGCLVAFLLFRSLPVALLGAGVLSWLAATFFLPINAPAPAALLGAVGVACVAGSWVAAARRRPRARGAEPDHGLDREAAA